MLLVQSILRRVTTLAQRHNTLRLRCLALRQENYYLKKLLCTKTKEAIEDAYEPSPMETTPSIIRRRSDEGDSGGV